MAAVTAVVFTIAAGTAVAAVTAVSGDDVVTATVLLLWLVVMLS